MDELSSEATGGSNGRRMVTRLLSEKSVGSGGLFVSLYPHCHSGMLTKSGTLLSFTSRQYRRQRRELSYSCIVTVKRCHEI